jgi:hypothetical protein
MSNTRGFVRPGREDIDSTREMFSRADYFSVVLYYQLMKEDVDLIPILSKKTDFDDAPIELAEGLDRIIQSMMTELEQNDIDLRRQDASIRDINIFSFIMSDPLLKQAIGNVAIQVIMRDEKVDNDSATEQAREALPEIMGDFQHTFLPYLMSSPINQIFAKMAEHKMELKGAVKILEPKIDTIKYKSKYMHGFKVAEELAIKLYFEDPIIDATDTVDTDKRSADSMFG